jgi:hypothetical protein
MTDAQTIWMALDLLNAPAGVKQLRASPLPRDVELLLRIAAGEQDAIAKAATATRQSTHKIREAAGFYIEQIMLYPDADHYRVLGAQPTASIAELRRNMALLVRWLHPDRHDGGDRSVFAGRVTKAWSDLKTEDKRAAYNLSRRRSLAKKPDKNKTAQQRASRHSTHSRRQLSTRAHPGVLMRMLLMLFGKTLP